MGFWLRNLIFGLILATSAYFLLANKEILQVIIGGFSSSSSEVAEKSMNKPALEDEDQTNIEKPPVQAMPAKNMAKPMKKPEKKSSNAAAEGLSRFYANINPDFDEDGPKIRENVVYLPKPTGDLSKMLTAKAKVTSPLKQHWRGDKTARPFRQGETLYQKLNEYANQQGLEVIWWLNRDFLVKDAFRINQDIVKTAYQIGKAIEGHFQNGIDIYFCYKQRTLVLISDEKPFLDKECRLIQG